VFVFCKKGAVENPNFSFLRKAKEEIEMLMNIELLQPELKKFRGQLEGSVCSKSSKWYKNCSKL